MARMATQIVEGCQGLSTIHSRLHTQEWLFPSGLAVAKYDNAIGQDSVAGSLRVSAFSRMWSVSKVQ